jgi:type IV fimbrial biogenesis protein FimT
MFMNHRFLRRPRRHGQRGVSLIELLVTLTVMTILLAVAVPGMQSFILSNRLRNLGNDFTAAVQRSRSEAMTQNQCVVLCMSSTTGNAAPFCQSTGTNWAIGWVAYRLPTCDTDDRPTTTATATTAAPNLVFTQPASTTSLRLNTASTVRHIMFTPRGIINLSAADRFNLQDTNATSAQNTQYGRSICLDKVGRTRNITLAASC